MKNEEIKAWLTENALTQGIIEVVGEVKDDISDSLLHYKIGLVYKCALAKDWHRTYEAALVRAEEMRLTKISLLRKSIVKLKAKKFTLIKV